MSQIIKICGITNEQLIPEIAKTGATHIGLLFHPKSKRHIDLSTAATICQAAKQHNLIPVAVCVDQNANTMQQLCDQLAIDHIQVHGDTARGEQHKLSKRLTRFYALPIQKDGQPDPTAFAGIDYLDPQRDFLLVDNMQGGSGRLLPIDKLTIPEGFRCILAGGLNHTNVNYAMQKTGINNIDVSSGVENNAGQKTVRDIQLFIKAVKRKQSILQADGRGRFDEFGGCYIPEGLISAISQLRDNYQQFIHDPVFREDFTTRLRQYAGRPTPLTPVKQFAKSINGPTILLKREDLLHTGAHKINNALGQCLLAHYAGKSRVIAETGAGQHGVATATACATLGLQCVVYMGSIDMARQHPNVERMRLLGAQVISVDSGAKTLKDAVNEALRDYAANFDNSHYCLGSALGPHPFPEMVSHFQSVIGQEAREQCLALMGRLPDAAIACVGGGSNAIGLFSGFEHDASVALIGVEAGGRGDALGEHAARLRQAKTGVLHGCFSYVLQDQHGQVANTHSISAGLDYPSIGPQHAALFQRERAIYSTVSDEDALLAFKQLSQTEGIIPALESSHALAYVAKHAEQYNKNDIILVNLSGRGDKDLPGLLARPGFL